MNIMAYMDTGLKSSLPSTADWQSKKKSRHTRMDDQRKDHPDPKMTPSKKPPQITTDQ